MRTYGLALLALLPVACATTRTTPDQSAARTIALELLDRGARSWNRGDLVADALNPDAVHVVAWYKLMRGDSLIARGPTSLVLVRDGARWGILKDHSS